MGKIDLKDYLERLEEPEDREAVANSEYQRELFEEYVQRGDNFPQLRAQLLKDYRACLLYTSDAADEYITV